MAMVASPAGGTYIAKSPPLSPPPAVKKTTYNGQQRATVPTTPPASRAQGGQLVEGILLVLRAVAALLAFVGVALVASCRHGDWMEFPRYQEYRYLLGASVIAFLYSATQALRGFRRMRRAGAYAARSDSFLDFAGDQAVAYLVMTASAAALPITIRMRSAVVNTFTDTIAASIILAFLAFAALALSAMLSGYNLSRQPYY